MKKKLAVYRHDYGFDVVYEVADSVTESKRVRVSEFVEVHFPDRSQDEIINEQVKRCDDVINDLLEQINKVRATKSELLSLEFQP